MNRRKFMLTAGASLAAPGLAAASLIPPSKEAAAKNDAAPQQPHRPNVIVMICDDLGYGDLGCYGSKLPTSNIDRLATNGVRFTNHSTPHPVCSAARAALLTGLYPTRVNSPGVFSPLDVDGMSTDAATIADLLKATGYNTMAIGKWHLGHAEPYLPTNRGFDDFYGVPYSVDMAPLPLLHGRKILEDDADRDLLTQKYTEKAVSFIEQSREHPFFLYLAYSYPHIPLHASKNFRGRSKSGLYGDTVAEIDWSVGEVMKALKKNGIEKNTLVIFTSDHGPWYEGSTGELRGRKGSTYEGGVRIPMIATLPGTLPEGKVFDGLTSHMDMMPTVANLCGAKLPERPLDGLNVWDLFAGKQHSIERKALLSFYGWNIQGARWKQWKLHVSRLNSPLYFPVPKQGRVNCALQHPELYNLSDDPKESYDTAAQYPDVVASIQKNLAEQLSGLPVRVQKAYAASQEHPSNPWMPADGPPEFASTKPGSSVWRVGADAEVVLQRFRAMEPEPK